MGIYKQSQSRSNTQHTQGSKEVKQQFTFSLEQIQKSMQRTKQREKQNGSVMSEKGDMQGQGQRGIPVGGLYPELVNDMQKGGFTFNPAATAFTPKCGGGGGGGGGSGGGSGGGGSGQSKPQFVINPSNPDLLCRSLNSILDCFFEGLRSEPKEQPTPEWPEATGSSYHDALGQPNSCSHPTTMGMTGGAVLTNWQQVPAQINSGVPGCIAPNMVQQGFVMAPQQGGQSTNIMPLYGPGPAAGQRPPNAGNVPSQQPMVFNQQQHMMVQQQFVPMSGGMVGSQGSQNPAMPKFTSQTMMPIVMQPGQFQSPGFVHQQNQGQPSHLGPQGNGPQQNQMIPPQMFHRPMGGGVPHQMPGHDP